MAHESDERTDLAGDRTMLSNERTLAAWWRTAIAAVAGGVAFTRLYGDVGPQWLIRSGASALVALGLLILVVSMWRYRRTAARIDPGDIERVPKTGLLVGGLLLAASIMAAGAAIWMF
jgi:putative membrane protein